jgi:hypothetical protein
MGMSSKHEERIDAILERAQEKWKHCDEIKNKYRTNLLQYPLSQAVGMIHVSATQVSNAISILQFEEANRAHGIITITLALRSDSYCSLILSGSICIALYIFFGGRVST